MRKQMMVAVAVAVAVLVAGFAVADQVKLDPALPSYKAVSGVSGNISSIGSDTLNNLMTHWAETFQKFYPNTKVQIEGKGSSTAPRKKGKSSFMAPWKRSLHNASSPASKKSTRLSK